MICPANQPKINYIFVKKTVYLSEKGCTPKLSSFSSTNVFFKLHFGQKLSVKGNDS